MLRVALALILVLVVSAGCGDDGAAERGDEAQTEREARAVADADEDERTCDPRAGNEAYRGLRRLALRLKPAEAGLQPTPDLPRAFGVMMETGYPEGCATLVALADGTASLYLSSGGGMIGGGEHEQVARRAKRFVEAAEASLDSMPRASTAPLPSVGQVVLRALTYDGHHAVEASEDDLGYERHELSPLFFAGHEVITSLRRIDEARR